MRRSSIVLITLALATVVPGCAARAPDWPLPLEKTQHGPGTIEHVRRQLEGTWALRAFEIFENAQPRPVRAQGTLTYDGFGNLKVDGVILDPADPAALDDGSLLNYSGRVVIDPRRDELVLEDLHADSIDDQAREVLARSHVRRFRVDGNRLVLWLESGDGTPVARARFVRVGATR